MTAYVVFIIDTPKSIPRISGVYRDRRYLDADMKHKGFLYNEFDKTFYSGNHDKVYKIEEYPMDSLKE